MFGDFFSQVTFVDIFNGCMAAAFGVFYFYQIVYIFIVLLKQPPEQKSKKNHKYAVLIAARNEEIVIGNLLKSIREQDYPQDLIDIFVIADNCTDNTARIAAEQGATAVFERNNTELVGKGWALDWGYKRMRNEFSDAGHEAVFVFDADNVLDSKYFAEMNKVFDGGAIASTSYRNSKNYGSNWISAGYALWFLREAKYLSQARLTIKSSCAISGTGFFIAVQEIEKRGGWKWHLMTEDIEFSAETIGMGERISYCPTAILYDEQPTTFRDSWNQRLRWAYGFYQVLLRYGLKLVKGIFVNPRGSKFACYDMLATIAPGALVTVAVFAFNIAIIILGGVGIMSAGEMAASSASAIGFALLGYGQFTFSVGVLTTFTEWNQIHTTPVKKVFYAFTFPLFMITYIPIAVVALFKRATWKPIKHTIAVDTDQIKQQSKER